MSEGLSVQWVERFQHGDWRTVPSLVVDGHTIVVTGRQLKIAAVDAEDCAEAEVAAPATVIEALRACRREGLAVDLFTFVQGLTNAVPRHPYRVEWESVAAVPLKTYDEWWAELPQESRKNVRRAAKRGVEIRLDSVTDALVQQIVAINNEVPIRQGRRFTHYGESFDKVKLDFLAFSERSDLFCAYSGDELIGLVKIIYSGPVANIMKLQTKVSHADKRPANALLAAAIEKAHQRGATHVTYGLYRYGNQAWTTLMEFKKRHGFQEVMVPRYYVPLSMRGEASVRLNLHRGLVGVLPPALVQAARDMRARWRSSAAPAAPV